ncbi:glycoside hydrolase family 54 protein [Akanthomyces lecanii RCEF 1005]|uniref:Alpha-L-arabinofuranosidase n=1 Tax=Akanthomyces lecanii RCEF 1005 TaxID=1081108 RepID=A0A168AYK9_CORDF|nr:glycoside hydrolase family 54 protein [Akanthomyces lecanii RCEF 1005]
MVSYFSGSRISALGLAVLASPTRAAPCDIYAQGGTPCVAAHSTTRALYSGYIGPLYQVLRGSDSGHLNILPVSAGSVANAGAQDAFCTGTTCVITIIYDQSGRNNHITQAPPGGFNGPDVSGYDNLASAIGAPVTLDGKKAYGVFISPGTGYRNNKANGTAVGDASEGMYAVLDGTHFNGQCCFDYGNAETNNRDTGNGHMEAIYYGDSTFWGSGSGNGPWIMADLENGLFSGASTGKNDGNPSINARFLTATVKGGPNKWAIRGASANSNDLSTFYDGARPNAQGYNPMSKEGAIILGIGGDNSNGAQGTFYEGAMTSGYPSDDTEALVQSNIAAAKYAVTALTSGPALAVGSTVSLQATTAGFTARFIVHNGSAIVSEVVSSSSTAALKGRGSWVVRTGLGNAGCFSFEASDTPGSYMRHFNFQLQLNPSDGTKQFNEDATFCPLAGLSGEGNSFRSWSFPTRYFRHYYNELYISSNGGVHEFDNRASFNTDITWKVGKGFI